MPTFIGRRCELEKLDSYLNTISASFISEVEQKMKKLKTLKGFSLRPVLICVNGVSDDIADSGFFSNIIDFGQIFEE